MAAGCANVNGITGRSVADIARRRQVFTPRDVSHPRKWTQGAPAPRATLDAILLLHPGVVLLAIDPRALPIFRPLDAVLFDRANTPIGRRVGFLAIDTGLAALQ